MSKRRKVQAQNRAVENQIEKVDGEVLDDEEVDEDDEEPKKGFHPIAGLKKKKDELSNMTIGQAAKKVGLGVLGVAGVVGAYAWGEKKGYTKGFLDGSTPVDNEYSDDEDYSTDDETVDYSDEE